MKSYISNYKLNTSKVDNFKIVHISDIHYEKTFNLEKFKILLNDILNIKPNYICITGDLIDSYKVLDDETLYQIFINFINELNKIAKVIITLGNHEMNYKKYDAKKYSELIDKFRKTEAVILNSEIYVDNNIRFIGYNPTYDYYSKRGRNATLLVNDFNEMKFDIDNTKYNILLIHTPKDLLENKIYQKINNFNKIDLILAGHTHGGLVPNGIKGHFGIISPGKRLFPTNVRGILTKDNTSLIICSGITRLSYSAHFLRHFNNIYKMSINVIDINKS